MMKIFLGLCLLANSVPAYAFDYLSTYHVQGHLYGHGQDGNVYVLNPDRPERVGEIIPSKELFYGVTVFRDQLMGYSEGKSLYLLKGRTWKRIGINVQDVLVTGDRQNIVVLSDQDHSIYIYQGNLKEISLQKGKTVLVPKEIQFLKLPIPENGRIVKILRNVKGCRSGMALRVRRHYFHSATDDYCLE
jgi:hypothetical protein